MDIPELFISLFFLSLDDHEQKRSNAIKSQANSLATFLQSTIVKLHLIGG